MACNANKTHLLRTIASRGFAAQANPKVASSGRSEVQVTTLPNKLVVASVDGNALVSRVSIAFKAGSRYETYDNAGISHVLRATAGLTNKKSTVFGVTRNLQQVGASIACESDRETIAYSLQLRREDLDTGLKYLSDVATLQIFKPWEVNEVKTRVAEDLARLSPIEIAVDLVHRAAFRDTLGNSLFCPSRNVGNISSEQLLSYVRNNFNTNRAVVAGVGVDHQLLIAYARGLKLDNGSDATTPSTYRGGDLRVETRGKLATVAVVAQGAALTNQKEALAAAVLQRIAGAGEVVKKGDQNGIVSKAVTGVLKEPHVVNALNASFTDNGLVGFVLTANAKEAGAGVKAALQALKSANVSAADLTRGKEQLKRAVLESVETQSTLLGEIQAQSLLTGNVVAARDLIAAIDGVSASDVNAVAKKLSSGKLSVGAVGNLETVPHVSEL